MTKHILLFLFVIFAYPLFASAWQQKANFGGIGRHRGMGISIGNKGYMGGGHYNGAGPNIILDDWWEYDPSSNSWTQKANIPTPTYGSIGWGTATKGYIGAGYVAGGVYHVFDPATNSWSNTSSCPISATNRDCFMINGKGYVLSTSQMYEYDPNTDVWTQKTSCPVSIWSWSCAFETSTSGFVKAGANFYEYKPSADTWIARANFPGLTSSGATAFQVHGKGYIICGYDGSLGNVNSEVWQFDPGNGQWTQMNDFPGTSRRFHVSFTIGNKGFSGLGTNGTNFNDFWQFSYDPLGTNDLELSADDVKLYPNPILNNATLSIDTENFESLGHADLVITSLDGKIISKQSITQSAMNIERNSNKSGVYLYSIVKNQKVVYTGKLIYQ